MKKILFLFSGFLISQSMISQTITVSNNEPVFGDIRALTDYDTTTAVPKNAGLNQHWDFSSLQPGDVSSSMFVDPSTVPSASFFPLANLAEEDTTDGEYIFYKTTLSTISQIEVLGFYDNLQSPGAFTFSNTFIINKWPMSFGNSYSDTYSGSASNSTYSSSISTNATITASGTGTITVPGGVSYSNILQIRTVKDQTQYLSDAISTDTFVTHSIQYDYYGQNQKFPLLSVLYEAEADNNQFHDSFITILGNRVIATGIRDRNFDAEYAIYPNPAKDNFSVKLTNTANENCTIDIYTITGQLVKKSDLGKTTSIDQKISLNGLNSGVYLVKTSLGARQSSRRLVIE